MNYFQMTYQKHKESLSYFQSEDGKMAYLDMGKGEVILLLHGVPTSSWLYRKIIPLLVEKGYRIIAPDMLGYGASDKPEGYDIYSNEHMGKRLLALMDNLKIDQWTQVFHDGGGLWTWAMLEIDASKVSKLIMLNTIIYEAGFNPPLRFKKGWIAKLFTKLYSIPILQNLMIAPTFKNGIKNQDVINSDMLDGYKIPMIKDGHRAIYYFFTRTCNSLKDYTKLHRSLSIPLIVIWGIHDDMLVWNKIKDQVTNNFKLKEKDIYLLDAKHFIQEELPEKISDIIANN